jgi:hypothetical protein
MKLFIVENPRPLTMEHYNDVANAPLSASLSSGYALAVARQAGWDTVFEDFTAADDDPAAMAALILGESPDIVLFHWVYSWGHEPLVRDTLELLRQGSAAAIGAFGLFPTLARNRLMEYAPDLDFILSGEFEGSLAELLHAFSEKGSIRSLPGVALREQPFRSRPLHADISRLPIPDDVGSNCSYLSMNIATSRGCFGECSFCFIHRYYGCSHRRARDMPSLEREIETRLARREIRSLYFIDPTFIGLGVMERQRAVTISHLALSLGLPFGFETRVDSVASGVMAALAANGAKSIFLGIESGCDGVLRRIGKRIDTKQILRAVRIVRDSGMQLNIGFIMFEPDTTMDELAENYRFLDGLGLLDNHDLTVNLLYHNQIVLYGSTAWERFALEGRLLLDERLPFEGRYCFRDARVGLVCAAMGRLSLAYFLLRDSQRLPAGNCFTAPQSACFDGGNPVDLNELLKEAFLAFCAAAMALPEQRFTALEENYLARLQVLKMQ